MAETKPIAIKVTPWDSTGMRRTLDDCIANIVAQQSGLKTDHTWFDIKLVIMLLSCVLGLTAQFQPTPFPDNKIILGICVASYFLLSGIYQAIVWFVDGDYIFHSKPKMKKLDDMYTVILEGPKGTQLAKMEKSLGDFFTQDGHFSETAFRAALQSNISSVVASGQNKKKV